MLGFIVKYFAENFLDCGKECALLDKITSARGTGFYDENLTELHLMTANMKDLNLEQLNS